MENDIKKRCKSTVQAEDGMRKICKSTRKMYFVRFSSGHPQSERQVRASNFLRQFDKVLLRGVTAAEFESYVHRKIDEMNEHGKGKALEYSAWNHNGDDMVYVKSGDRLCGSLILHSANRVIADVDELNTY